MKFRLFAVLHLAFGLVGCDVLTETSNSSSTENPTITKNFSQDPLSSITPANLPDGIDDIRPLRDEFKNWSGVWRGQWEGTLDSYFVILEERDQRFKAAYSWGTNLIVANPDSIVIEGVLLGDTITFPFAPGESLVFKNKGKKLEALYYSPKRENISRAVFQLTEK